MDKFLGYSKIGIAFFVGGMLWALIITDIMGIPAIIAAFTWGICAHIAKYYAHRSLFVDKKNINRISRDWSESPEVRKL